MRIAPLLRASGGACGAIRMGPGIGLTGFEPATSPTRTERATKLRHSPMGRRLALPYCGCVSARRYIGLVLLVAFAGCSDGDSERTMATRPAVRTQSEEPAAPAQRRPVRLLRLGNFNEPTYLTAPRGDRRRFVVERAGTIRIVQGGRVLRRPFLDITDQAGFLQIDQFRTSAGAPNRAHPSSRRSVMRVPHHRGNHKGGQLQVGA